MAKEGNTLELVLYFVAAFLGVIGLVTIPALVAELYLLHAISKRNLAVTGEAVLATFTALNGAFVFVIYAMDVDPFLPVVLSTLTFLVLAVLIEGGVCCEVCGNRP
ncbi:hypothetical protein TEU_07330 [Thermococcus eurythermalis]|uniref:Uncharacterized protein n=2 Tax=Thermococcus eurythermalis TaxID=1505907 RepID=A0A097QUJ8_9EURY|nr:hypothetical protein TEU_07330 [Thermococcus eurythermalis]